MTQKAYKYTKPTGRPPLSDSEDTIRVGFAITTSLWNWFAKKAEKREISYSALFRELLEREQANEQKTLG